MRKWRHCLFYKHAKIDAFLFLLGPKKIDLLLQSRRRWEVGNNDMYVRFR